MGTKRRTFNTDAYYRSLKPKGDWQVDYPDDKEPGLTLRVSPQGGKVWAFRYRSPVDGKQRRMVLGKFQDHGVADARAWVIDRRREIAAGRDPAREKKERLERAARNKVRTLTDLWGLYSEAAKLGRHRPDARPLRASTLDLHRHYFERVIKPELGKLNIAEVTLSDIQGFLDKADKSSSSTARQCRALLRQLYAFAMRRQLVDRNPALYGEAPKPKSRERVLDEAELRTIWTTAANPSAIEDLHLSPVLGLALRFAMLTLQRGGEICGLHTDELDLEAKTWTIPGSRTKNHRTHVVPLSDAAVAIINDALALKRRKAKGKDEGEEDEPKGRFVFASPRADGPITRPALSHAAHRLCDKAKLRKATPHDFRRTGSTHLTGEGLGFSRFIVSRVLNHASDAGGAAAVTAVYDRNEYLPEKRRALDAWASRLEAIVSGRKKESNVLDMPRRA